MRRQITITKSQERCKSIYRHLEDELLIISRQEASLSVFRNNLTQQKSLRHKQKTKKTRIGEKKQDIEIVFLQSFHNLYEELKHY